MSPGAKDPTRAAGRAEGRSRLQVGKKYLDVAQLIDAEESDGDSTTVIIGLAVLAGIAASDSACILLVGKYSRGQGHREASRLLESVKDGTAAAKNLRILLALKDQAHYGFGTLKPSEAKSAIRAAQQLVDFATSAQR